MIKISDIVSDIIKGRPYLENLLSEDLINITALARNIKPEIESRLKKEIQTGAIVMAIKRQTFSKGILISEQYVNRHKIFGDIILRSNIEHYSFENSNSLRQKLGTLFNLIKDEKEVYFSLAQGVFESTIIISETFSEVLKELFIKERISNNISNLSAITIKLSEENVKIPGLYYLILKNLAWNNINLIEVISTAHEFTLIVEDEFIDKAFSVIKKMKSNI